MLTHPSVLHRAAPLPSGSAMLSPSVHLRGEWECRRFASGETSMPYPAFTEQTQTDHFSVGRHDLTISVNSAAIA
jgi:hypothetical protein